MKSKQKIQVLLTHPNTLTLFRVLSIPGIIILLLFPNRFNAVVAALLFSVASITDFFDGFLARRWGMVSNIGKLMDPLADKLLVSSTCIMLVSLGWVPGWIVCIIIGREIAVTGLRTLLVENQLDVSASQLGKYKTGFQIAAIIPLLFHYPFWGIDFQAIGSLYLWVALILTIWSGIDYFIRFKKLFY
ncbi:CDP-diacylglycerol--glycerol-3-phosphate 3-phosphatidyltransferase [Desulfococcaceae bacterium HSG9]|nr:CDP-diacylglycerol--glycerol-3-phosphate 3-phosphatidyltransferase [Desulfococcaceae bacterium HSG9]